MPFTEEQAPFFFGRDAEREIITANLIAARLTLLYGPSGVGKSSVLNAGVVHHLRRGGRDPALPGDRPQFCHRAVPNLAGRSARRPGARPSSARLASPPTGETVRRPAAICAAAD